MLTTTIEVSKTFGRDEYLENVKETISDFNDNTDFCATIIEIKEGIFSTIYIIEIKYEDEIDLIDFQACVELCC